MYCQKDTVSGPCFLYQNAPFSDASLVALVLPNILCGTFVCLLRQQQLGKKGEIWRENG